MTNYRRHALNHGLRLALLCAVAAVTAPSPAWAQDFPQRPLTLVVPYPAGGATDVPWRASCPIPWPPSSASR